MQAGETPRPTYLTAKYIGIPENHPKILQKAGVPSSTTSRGKRYIGLLPAAFLLAACSLSALRWGPDRITVVQPGNGLATNSFSAVTPANPLFGNPSSPFGAPAGPTPPNGTTPTGRATGTPPLTGGAKGGPPMAGLIPPHGVPPAPIIGTTPGSPPTAGTTAPGSADPAAPVFARAVEAQRAGRMAEALQGYRDVLKLNPHAMPAYTNMALIYLQTKQPKLAIDQLRAAQKLDPRNPGLTAQLAQTLTADSQFEAAYAEWVKLAQSSPHEGEAAFAAGSIALQNLKRPADAEKWLRTSAQLSKSDPRPSLLLADFLMRSQRAKDAEAVLTAGTIRFPQTVQLWSMLSDVRLARGNKTGSIAALQEAQGHLPKNLADGPMGANLKFALGRAYAANANWKAAIESASAAAKILPNEPDIHGLLAESLLHTGARAAGAAELRRVLELDSKRHGVRVILARVLTDLNQPDQAQEQYTTYLKVRPDDGQAIMESAELYEKQKQEESALNLWSRAIKLMPDNALPPLRKAQLLDRMGRDGDALESYRYVLQIKPADPTALAAAAAIEEKQGETMRALAHLKALIEAGAADDKAYASLLRVAAKKDQLTATVNFLQLQLSKNPNRPAAYNAILNYHLQAGQPATGRNIVQEMIQRFPKSQAPRLALAAFDREHPLKATAKPTPTTRPEPTKPLTPQAPSHPSATAAPSIAPASESATPDKAAPVLSMAPDAEAKSVQPPAIKSAP